MAGEALQTFLDRIEASGRAGAPDDAFDARDAALLRYALALTAQPAAMTRAHVEALRAAGFDDGEVLDANQVTAYFAYANRLVDGLGVELESESSS